jgi:hypothetical protein
VTKSADQVARILLQCLDEAGSVEVDGLGVFRRSGAAYQFVPFSGPSVFLAYAVEDRLALERLYHALRCRGFNPWLDRKKLLPGQNWPRAIQQAIEVSDYFVACFSRQSTEKRGQFQAEMRYALDCARRAPLDRTYFIPVRLEECRVPPSISREIQYVDLFPDWDEGVSRLAEAIKGHNKARIELPLGGQ